MTDIKLLVLDIDGVLTDGLVYYTVQGEAMKKFNTKDGVAAKMVMNKGIEVGLISWGLSNSDGIIKARADVLGIKRVFVGLRPKAEVLREWCAELKITPQQVAFVGDDVNDIDCIKFSGLTACPSDAVNAVKKEVDHVLTRRGGDACVREFVERYLLV